MWSNLLEHLQTYENTAYGIKQKQNFYNFKNLKVNIWCDHVLFFNIA